MSNPEVDQLIQDSVAARSIERSAYFGRLNYQDQRYQKAHRIGQVDSRDSVSTIARDFTTGGRQRVTYSHTNRALVPGLRVRLTPGNTVSVDAKPQFQTTLPVVTRVAGAESVAIETFLVQDLIHLGADGVSEITDIIGSALTLQNGVTTTLSGGPYASVTNSGYVTFGPPGQRILWVEEPAPENDFAIEFWIYLDGSNPLDGDSPIFRLFRIYDAPNLNSVDLEIALIFNKIDDVSLVFFYSGAFALISGTLAIDTWMFVQVSVESDVARLYIDSVLIDSESQTGERSRTFTNYAWGYTFPSIPQFNTRIADFRFTPDRPRSPAIPTGPLQND